MHDPENSFPPELLDQQIEQPDTRLPRGEARLVHDLQTMYGQEKNDAIERVWQRMAQHRNTASQQPEMLSLSERRQEPSRSFPMKQIYRIPKPQKRFARILNLTAAVLICVLLIGSIALVLHLAQHLTTNLGSQPDATTTAAPGATSAPTGEKEGKIISSWSQTQPGPDQFRSFSWSPNSQYIAADSQENVQIRDAATGKNVLTITPGGLSAAWSPNGHYLAVDNTIIDATTGKLVRKLLNSVAFTSPTSSSLLSTMLPRSGGNVIYTVAWSPDSSMLAGALSGLAYGNKVIIWNINTGQIVYTFLGQSADTVGSLSWSPDGKYIASASFDGIVKVWNARTGQVIFHHTDNVRVEGLAWAPTGLTLAFLSNASTIQVWDVTANKKITSYNTPINGPLTWSPDGTKIACVSNANVIIWNATTGTTIYTFTEQQTNYISALAWSPNGKYLVSSSETYPASPGSPTPTIKPGTYALVWIA